MRYGGLFQTLRGSVVKWLWPEVCPFCGKVSSQGICAGCRRKIDDLKVREPRCMQCGKPVQDTRREYCYDCMHMEHRYDRGYGLWLHKEPVSTSIYQFKYHNQRDYGVCYAKELIRCYGNIIKSWTPDLMIPIPLHKKRRRQRGYNQAAVICQELGRMLGIPGDEKSLYRKFYTDPQKTLSHKERRKNLKHAFALKKGFRVVPTVLLIDDIYTTGNTIDAAASVLKKKGVEKVYFLTISIGQGY